MLPGSSRQRVFALASVLSFAFFLGAFYGREHLYDTVRGWSIEHGRADSVRWTPSNGRASPFEEDSLAAGAGAKANAAFVILVRNQDLASILESLQQVELHFNRKHHYPFVFLNDVPFEDHFIQSTSSAVSGDAHYGLVPQEHWHEPEWIDQTKAAERRKSMEKANVIYGGSESYRRMCRYQSGFFYRHELLQSYDYYWRIEPGVRYFCDIDYDPFVWMQENNKKYAFTISIKEYEATIPTLWSTTKQFIEQHPEHVAEDNSLWWISENNGDTYNLCHFWSNFEIGSLEFLRSPAYTEYFDFLDRAGGFSYERWGDAPVHSIAAALFLPTDQVHFFSDIGYYHIPFQQCPVDAQQKGCFCDPSKSFEFHWYSCTSRWHELLKKKGLQ